MITYDRVEEALTYLAETDAREAELRAEVEGAKKQREAIFDTIAAHAEGTVLERHAAAYNDDKYIQAENKYLETLANHGEIKNIRHRNELVIEVWRSINSARNKGQVI